MSDELERSYNHGYGDGLRDGKKDMKPLIRKMRKCLKTLVDRYEFDTEDCAKRHEGKACKRCQAIIEARAILPGAK